MKKVLPLILAVAFAVVLCLPLLTGQAGAQASETPLRVAALIQRPFVFLDEDGQLSGFSVDLAQALAADLDSETQWIMVESVPELLSAVQDGRAEAAISAISMTAEREETIDFTHPYLDAGLGIMTRSDANSSLSPLQDMIFSPAFVKILGIGFLTLLVIGHVIWLVERGNNPDVPKGYLRGVWEGLWWALSTIAANQYGDGEKPKRPFNRLVAMGLIVLGIILIAQFTAAVTATMTVQTLEGQIRNVNDLPGRAIATLEGSSAASYLDEHGLAYQGVARIEQAYDLLKRGEVEAVVFDMPVLQYYAQNEGRGRVEIAGSIFHPEAYAIVLPPGSRLREPLNAAILHLMENGDYDQLVEKWFGVLE